MRPAQKAPENQGMSRRLAAAWSGFNEAGAKSAGKLRQEGLRRHPRIGFNEAGAKSAGKRSAARPGPSRWPRFNEAGAKSAGKL